MFSLCPDIPKRCDPTFLYFPTLNAPWNPGLDGGACHFASLSRGIVIPTVAFAGSLTMAILNPDDFIFRIQDRAQFFEGKIGYLMFAFPTQINPCRPVVRIFANAHNSCFNFGFHAFIPSSCACPFSCSGGVAPILNTGSRDVETEPSRQSRGA